MKKGNGFFNLKILSSLLVLLVSGFAAQSVFGQGGLSYNQVYDCPTSGGYGRMQFKVLSCGADDWCKVWLINSSPEGGYEDSLDTKTLDSWLKRVDNKGKKCTVNGQLLPAANAPQQAANPRQNNTSPAQAKPADPQAAKPAHTGGTSCVAAQPAGTVSRNTKASPSLFQRVIYERYRDIEQGRPTGMSFANFVQVDSYKNGLTPYGLRHDGAPNGAQVYRYKTDYVHCVKYTDSIIRYDVKEAYYSCFKDKSGDWSCPNEGHKAQKQSYLPVN